MRTLLPFSALGLLTLMTATAFSDNLLLSDWHTPFQVPPFDAVQLDDYRPAFDEAMKQHAQEIRAIYLQRSVPTFDNTIAALDRSGLLLDRVSSLFFAMKSSMNNEQMEAIAREVVPLLSQHEDEIKLNDLLFQRIKTVYETQEQMNLTAEQRKLLKEFYRGFVRGGANLAPEQKERLKELNSRLSVLSVRFGENVLKEENRFELVLEQESELAGLPPDVVTGAAVAAQEHGQPGKWVFTLHKPSMIPFLQYAERRDLREKIYQAYLNRGNHDDELDNKAILAEMVQLRAERARLLGYPTHAHYVLEENMAKEPARVYQLLMRLWEPALCRAKGEARDMQALIDQQGGDFQLAPWDWWYYAEKVKQAKYDLDEEMLRPYFKLENVRQGVFNVATRLFGLQFESRPDIPVYHPDVSAFEVRDGDGTHVGILYVDYFPRASKRGGAWMGELRQQMKYDGTDVRPVVYNVGNFSKPTPGKPSLLSLEEVETLFHEFGHALHGLLSDCTYKTLAGTNVARDFVELPSQIMENWATEPEVLKQYARHFETDQPMPDELIAKIRRAQHFNQGFATTEYLAAAVLDMDWHTRIEPGQEIDVPAFEQDSLNRIGLIPEIISRYRSSYFNHVFSGGYSAGYYAYIWAEVLDADAFQAFKETGDIFNPKVARAFREHILSRGGTAEPMELYQQFRGHEPGIDALLERRELTPQLVWVPLADGQTLAGWHTNGEGEWTVEDGAFVGRSHNAPLYGHLVSDQTYQDFTVRFEFRCPSGDSGFFIRTEMQDPDKTLGLQVQVGPCGTGNGGIYESYGRGWLQQPTKELEQACYRLDGWNEMIIAAQGPRVTVHVNGVKTADLNDPAIAQHAGVFALQMHSGVVNETRFRNLALLKEGAIVPRRFLGTDPLPVEVSAGGGYVLDAPSGLGVGSDVRYRPDSGVFSYFADGDRVEWPVHVTTAGTYDVWAAWSREEDSARPHFSLDIGDQQIAGDVAATGGADTYERAKIGQVSLAAGAQQVVLRITGASASPRLNLQEIRLLPTR